MLCCCCFGYYCNFVHFFSLCGSVLPRLFTVFDTLNSSWCTQNVMQRSSFAMPYLFWSVWCVWFIIGVYDSSLLYGAGCFFFHFILWVFFVAKVVFSLLSTWIPLFRVFHRLSAFGLNNAHNIRARGYKAPIIIAVMWISEYCMLWRLILYICAACFFGSIEKKLNVNRANQITNIF